VIFAADDAPGRKFFYRPSVTLEHGYTIVALGSGDRPHPLNTAGVDRLYLIKDHGQKFEPGQPATLIRETHLIDVTDNELQGLDTTSDRRQEILETILTSHGLFIRLNQHAGEKVLAAPLIFNKVAYYTTYTPNADVSVDPCSPGNLGISRIYAIDYKTGEAVLDLDKTNNSDEGSNPNADKGDYVLDRDDRSRTLGQGIPSGIVVIMPPSGEAELLIGCGGGLCAEDPTLGGTIFPIYWIKY
jgi:type IV pilus assembly protein PilY1